MAVPKILDRSIPEIDLTAEFDKEYFRAGTPITFTWHVGDRSQRTYMTGVERIPLGDGVTSFSKATLNDGMEIISNFVEDCWRIVGCVFCGHGRQVRDEVKTVKHYFHFHSTFSYVYGISWNMVERASRTDGTLDTANKYFPPDGWYIIPESVCPLNAERMAFAVVNPSTNIAKIIILNSVTQESESQEIPVYIGQWQTKIDMIYSTTYDKFYVGVIQQNALAGFIFNGGLSLDSNFYFDNHYAPNPPFYIRCLDVTAEDKFRIIVSSPYGSMTLYNDTGQVYSKYVEVISVKSGHYCSSHAFFDADGNALYSSSEAMWDFVYDPANNVLFYVGVDDSKSPFMAEIFRVDLNTSTKTRLGSLTVLPENGEQWFGRMWEDTTGYLLAGIYALDGKKVVRKFAKTGTGQDYTISV